MSAIEVTRRLIHDEDGVRIWEVINAETGEVIGQDCQSVEPSE